MQNSILPNSEWFSKDPKVCNTNYYKIIVKCFTKLWQLGVLHRSAGQCLAISDVVSKLLKSEGIESEIFECNLLIQNKLTGSFNFIGYEYDANIDCNGVSTNIVNDGVLKNHIVVITKTEVPIIIDLTCTYIDTQYPFIIQPILDYDKNDTFVIDLPTSEWTYSKKEHTHVPFLYQNSIIERIKKDNLLDKELKLILSKLNKINYIVVLLSVIASVNFIRGAYDFHSKYINKTNGWGPDPNYIYKKP